MRHLKIKFVKIFFLFTLQVMAYSPSCFGFLEEDYIRAPIGSVNGAPHYVTFPPGSSIEERHERISRGRESLGLSSQIPLSEQENILQLSWQKTNANAQKAFMPGQMLRILVTTGQQIQRGSPLCTIETMKMEWTIRSPIEGEVTLHCQEGETIAFNDRLVSILPTFARWEDINQDLMVQHRNLLLSFFPWAPVPIVEAPEINNENDAPQELGGIPLLVPDPPPSFLIFTTLSCFRCAVQSFSNTRGRECYK